MSFEDEESVPYEDEDEGESGASPIDGNVEELDEHALEAGNVMFGPYGPVEVNESVFEELRLPPAMVEGIQHGWEVFLNSCDSRMAAGEAVYGTIFEAAPSLQSIFRTPRAVQGMRFIDGMCQIIGTLHDPPANKIVLETLGFQHLDLEVTGPRTIIFRDAIVDLLAQELGAAVTPPIQIGLLTLLNYVGGSFIYVRVQYADRIRTILTSWGNANNKAAAVEDGEGMENEALEEHVELEAQVEDDPKEKKSKKKNRKSSSGDNKSQKASMDMTGKDKTDFKNTSVPQTFNDMFAFNTAVMGMSGHNWMGEILLSFDAIVNNTANSYRLQEECDVVSLRLAKYKGQLNLSEFKSVMLASLRSLCKDWGSHHEVSWSWLWANVERLLKAMLGRPKQLEHALSEFLKAVDENTMVTIRREIYSKFFAMAPAGQDYFKQSTTRLHFIADKLVAMTLDMYKDPKKLVEDISALGLRHVGYGIPTELFGPFVTACVQVVADLAREPMQEEAFRWSLGLVSRILVRVITEGSTIVMKAINANSAKMLKKAVDCAPRGKRAIWMLNVQVGTQSISPFMLAIKNGSLEAAQAILVDLLTIRADRDRYYYGVDMLFQRHPDVVRRICLDAPPLLPTLLKGLVWRSRTTENGLRRVNYYVQHLIIDGEGGFAKATEWLCDFEEPKVMCDSVVALVTDTVWSQVVFHNFLFGKAWFLFTLMVFCVGQSILTRHGEEEDITTSQEQLLIVFSLRAFIYVFAMGAMIRHHVALVWRCFKQKDVTWYKYFPVPNYLWSWQEFLGFLLTLNLIMMLCLEPVLHCINAASDDLFSQACKEGQSVKFIYSLFSSVGIVLFALLLTDLSVLSTRVSAFVLVCRRVLSELFICIGASAFLVVTFTFAVCALEQGDENFDGLGRSMLHLVQLTLGMVAGDDNDILQDFPALLVAALIYMIASSVFLLNMLVAQLTCAYQATYDDMVGYARLNRGRIIVETVPSVSTKRWERFVNHLELDQPIEFGEGDIGLAGGIQVLEPASLNITTVDMIKRYGGTTSPAAQWPVEESTNHDEMDKFEHLEKVVEKALKRMAKITKGGGATSGASGFGSSMAGASNLDSSSHSQSDSL